MATCSPLIALMQLLLRLFLLFKYIVNVNSDNNNVELVSSGLLDEPLQHVPISSQL